MINKKMWYIGKTIVSKSNNLKKIVENFLSMKFVFLAKGV
jgi:hypothetical protein